MRLSRDDILKAEDNQPEEVDVPEWGGSVLVRGMTGRERDDFELSFRQRDRRGVVVGVTNMSNIRAKLISRCVVDDDGKLMFTAADIAALGDKSGAPMDRLYDVACRLSGMGSEDMEELAEDFGPADGAGSSSSSPSASTRRPGNSSKRPRAGN